MADCDNRTGFQKFLSILPIATALTILVLALSFGRAWGQIREEVTATKQALAKTEERVGNIPERLSKMEANIEWLVKSVDTMMREKE